MKTASAGEKPHKNEETPLFWTLAKLNFIFCPNETGDLNAKSQIF